MRQNVNGLKRRVEIAETQIQIAKRIARSVALICGAGIILWLGIRFASRMVDRTLAIIFTGGAR